MKKDNTWIRPLLVIILISGLSALAVLNRTDAEIKLLQSSNQTLKNSVDSLEMEIFILNVEIGRHEITREEILSKYPNVKKEYENYYEHQTE